MLDRLKQWAKALYRDIIALWLAGKSSETPFLARLVAAITAAYAFSPIDLIPDFIPVLGYLDDLLIVPLGIWLAIELIPPALMAQYRDQAASVARKPVSTAGMVAVLAIWLGLLALGWGLFLSG